MDYTSCCVPFIGWTGSSVFFSAIHWEFSSHSIYSLQAAILVPTTSTTGQTWRVHSDHQLEPLNPQAQVQKCVENLQSLPQQMEVSWRKGDWKVQGPDLCCLVNTWAVWSLPLRKSWPWSWTCWHFNTMPSFRLCWIPKYSAHQDPRIVLCSRAWFLRHGMTIGFWNDFMIKIDCYVYFWFSLFHVIAFCFLSFLLFQSPEVLMVLTCSEM